MPRRFPERTRAALAVAAGLLAAGGCESMRPAAPPDTGGPPPGVTAVAAQAPAGPNPAPGHHATRRGSYVFYHDFELDRGDPLFDELEALPDAVFGELRLPPTTAIVQVFLFDTQERYERYMKAHPSYRRLPTRRAYFIAEPKLGGGGDDLKVFTWMGDHLRTDLRHELTHALLHGVLKDVPLWLDEGLAGYYELPPANDGVNGQHLEMLRRGPFQPDLGRLEKLDQVRQMEKPEYREAWAWVHLMLRSTPEAKQVLRDYLQGLRTNATPGPLLPKLAAAVGDPDAALAAHLGRLDYPRR